MFAHDGMMGILSLEISTTHENGQWQIIHGRRIQEILLCEGGLIFLKFLLVVVDVCSYENKDEAMG